MTNRAKLSVVLAVLNEESNIDLCLGSVKEIADEIIVFDEHSTDKTRDIAKKYGAKVYKYKHRDNFHETKQAAIEKATSDWILQLDADERVTPDLAKEIIEVINSNKEELSDRVVRHPDSKREDRAKLEGSKNSRQLPITNHKLKLFFRHQKAIEQREGTLGKPTGTSGPEGSQARREVVAFFVPRINLFLGEPLTHAGVYPDGVIRLFKKGKARLPARSVHELMEVDGEVGWLFNDLEHHESPTFKRYLERANRYTDLTAKNMEKESMPTNPLYLIYYSFFKPVIVFMNLYFRHLGFLDGMRGFIWSAFSAMHYPLAYFKHWQKVKS